MCKKIEIPEMSKNEIEKWCQIIRPIIRKNELPYFLRNLSNSELTDTAYISLENVEPANLEIMKEIATTTMLHKHNENGFFNANVGEVIRQIPKHLLGNIVAFEIVSPLSKDEYNEEFDAGYHVSYVKLYGKMAG